MLKPGLALGLASLIFLAGCGSREVATVHQTDSVGTASDVLAGDPDQRLFEQVRAGRFQLDAALNSIESTYRQAVELRDHATDPVAKDKLSFVVEMLDGTGRAMAEHGGAQPTLEEVRRDPAVTRKKSESIVEDANDSLHDLHDAQELLTELASGGDPQYEELSRLNGLAMDDLRSVIHTLGGQAEVPGATP